MDTDNLAQKTEKLKINNFLIFFIGIIKKLFIIYLVFYFFINVNKKIF